MSTQPIPTAAQIAAARFSLWHQAVPDTQVAETSESASQAEPVDPPTAEDSSPAADDTSENNATEEPSEPSTSDGVTAEPETPVSSPNPAASPAILTQSAAREFLNRAGLLLFSSRSQLSGVPAPTFVEATLGVANANPSLTATETARTLLAHLVADGSAIPLNLLGLPTTTGEAPDFIASAAAFPYIFTLRGDKAWKQPPVTSGTTKVSPLAANTYTLLIENGPQSAYALAGTLGKEVTEAAVLRGLSELWQQLRVLPVPQPHGKPTLWEPITTRFTKQIKTGANAGQPTALSTFISLFLGQAILATEDEIETFLSPLAPRSRVRDVLHALSAGRQLETMTIEGRHHLHVTGDLPLFAVASEPQPAEAPELAEDGSRIKKFIPKPRKLGTGFVERPKPFRASSDRSGRSDSRPVRKPAAARFNADSAPRPTFDKPWEEEKRVRAARQPDASAPEFQDIDLDAAAPLGTSAPRAGKPIFSRKPFAKPGFGSRPASGGDRPAFNRSRPAGDRPAFNRDRNGSDRPPFNPDRPRYDRPSREGASDRFQPRDARRDFTPHSGAADTRPPRKPFTKSGFAGKPAFGDKRSFPRKPFDAAGSAGDRERRPFRRDDASGDARPPRRTFDSGPSNSRSPFAGKPRFERDRSSEGGSRPPYRKFDAPRSPRPQRDDAETRPSRPRFDSDRTAPRGGGFSGSKSFGSKPFARRSDSADAPRGGSFTSREGGSSPRREASGGARREGGFAGKKSFAPRPAGSSGDRSGSPRPFTRSSPDAPGAGTFDKFKGGNKPWGKRPPARKYKPKGEGE